MERLPRQIEGIQGQYMALEGPGTRGHSRELENYHWGGNKETPHPNTPNEAARIEDSGSLRSPNLRVQVPNHKVSTQNHNCDSLYGNPKYPMVRYFGPLGF